MRAFTDPRPSTGFRALARLLVVAVLIVCGAVASVSPAGAVTVASMAPRSVADTVVKTSLSGFDPGTLISDDLFYDSNAMSASDIQSFLDSKIGTCTNGRCLNVLNVDISSRPARYSTTTGNLVCESIQGGSMRVSELVYRMQVACGISAKVILVTLQKEQGLVTNDGPSDWNLSAAMGQSCPDTAPCDPAYAGVGPQIVAGVTQLKIYKAARFGKQPGVQYIQYNPNADCGGTTINVTNYATAALYSYTPYQPNPASLAAGWGLGDGCSSYGNRNFYNYYTSWFGPASTANNPFGGYNLVVERGQFTVRGWALDPNAKNTPLTISVSVNGVENWATFTANDNRPDVAAAHPGYGALSGMNSTFEVVGGDQRICVTARNVGAGSDQAFGCTDVFVETASPYGGASTTPIAGGLHILGWTLDTDTPSPLNVHVYIDGVASVYRADAIRPDVGAAFPGMGNSHGIDLTIQTSVGTHTVCTYGINVGRGMNKLLGCDTVDVPSADPIGSVDSLYAEPGGFRIRGWAADPNTNSNLSVHVYRDAVGTQIRTGTPRSDVLAAFPFAGANAGFDAHIDAPPGNTRVCAYGINVGWGSNAGIGCGTVSVLRGNPIGGISASVDGTTVHVRGWAIDPDVTQPIPVHLYVDGAGQAVDADFNRPDVGAAYPGYGASHGVDTSLDLSAGDHSICAYGINAGPGQNALLNCVQVVIEDHSPFGGTTVVGTDHGARITGWVIDPDVTDPVIVHVYVDGVGTAIVRADTQRPDVARIYPAYGPAHGIDTTLALTAGAHQICSYGINQGSGSNASLGCYSVTTP